MLRFVALEAGAIFFPHTGQLATGTVVTPVHSWKDRNVGWGVLKVECLVGTTTGGVLFLLAVDNWSRLDMFVRATGLAMSLGLPMPTTAVTCSDFLTPCCLRRANLIITHLIIPALPLIHRLCHFLLSVHLGVFCCHAPNVFGTVDMEKVSR